MNGPNEEFRAFIGDRATRLRDEEELYRLLEMIDAALAEDVDPDGIEQADADDLLSSSWVSWRLRYSRP